MLWTYPNTFNTNWSFNNFHIHILTTPIYKMEKNGAIKWKLRQCSANKNVGFRMKLIAVGQNNECKARRGILKRALNRIPTADNQTWADIKQKRICCVINAKMHSGGCGVNPGIKTGNWEITGNTDKNRNKDEGLLGLQRMLINIFI